MSEVADRVVWSWQLSQHQRRKTRELRALVERRQAAYLWGKKHFITPLLLDTIFGDGKRLVAIGPIVLRPNFYIVRVHSAWHLSNWADDDGNDYLVDHIDEIEQEIEDQFGDATRCEEDGSHKKGWWSCRHCRWPAADFGTGCEWWEVDWPQELRAKGGAA